MTPVRRARQEPNNEQPQLLHFPHHITTPPPSGSTAISLPCAQRVAGMSNPLMHDLSTLAVLHSSVSWRLRCRCEEFWSASEPYPHMGCITSSLSKPILLGRGTGVGSHGKPQGYPCQSLVLPSKYFPIEIPAEYGMKPPLISRR